MKKPVILAALLAAAVALVIWLAGGWGTPQAEPTAPAGPAEPATTRPTTDPATPEPSTADPTGATPTTGRTPEDSTPGAAPNGAGDPMLSGEPRHPSAAPTPSGFTWPEPAPAHTPASPDATPRGMPDLDKAATNPRDLSKAFTLAVFTQDTATDASPHDAVERACQVCTDELTQGMAAGAHLNPSDEWLQLVQADGWRTASVEENTDRAAEPDNPKTERWFSWIVTPQVHGLDQEPQEATPITYIRVVDPDEDGTWEVDSYQVR